MDIKAWLFAPVLSVACSFPPVPGGDKAIGNAHVPCIPVAHIDGWRAYDDDTLSVFQKGREVARVDIHTSGTSDTWIMHAVHVVRYEAGDDGQLCPHGSDTLVLDGQRHFIEHVEVLKPPSDANK